jgi:DNA polymerase V
MPCPRGYPIVSNCIQSGQSPISGIAQLWGDESKKSGDGVVDITLHDLDAVLGGIAVEDVWGIGRRWGRSLRDLGIETALQLREASPTWVK